MTKLTGIKFYQAPDFVSEAGKWFVTNTIRKTYLHQDGSWQDIALSKEGPTGYFTTKAEAERTLAQATGVPLESVQVMSFMQELDAFGGRAASSNNATIVAAAKALLALHGSMQAGPDFFSAMVDEVDQVAARQLKIVRCGQ